MDNGVEEVYVVAEPVTRRPLAPLDPDELAGHLGAGGALSRLLPRYEERPSQLTMLRSVCAAFNEGRLCLAEAGTGVGKSLAYLVPAFAWALQNDERVVISTATINLQQQLVDQDVPLVRRVLGRDPGVALVKGRGNYLCLTRLDEARREQSLFEEEERELEALADWAAATPTGCRSDLPAHVPDEVWQRVCSEADACRGLRCPRREDCFVLRSRREAAAARILIVNHHLLFSDLSLRAAGAGFEGSAVLPPFQRIVFDEAHNIENSATSFFSEAFSRLMIAKYAGRLHRHRKGRALGLLPVLERLTGPGEPIVAIRRALEELQARAETLEAAAFRVMGGASSWRLGAVKAAARDAAPAPLGEMMEAMDELGRSIRSLIQRFEAVFGSLGEEERESGVVYECQIELRRLAGVAEVCDQFLRAAESPGRIFWMEAQKSFRGERYLRFVVTPLEIAELMNEAVYEPYGTVVFTSATLTVGGGFDFWKTRVGLAAGGPPGRTGTPSSRAVSRPPSTTRRGSCSRCRRTRRGRRTAATRPSSPRRCANC